MKNKLLTGTALSLLVAGVMVLPQASLASTKAEKLANAADQLQTNLQTAYSSLDEAQQAAVYTKRYTKATTALDTAEQSVEDAKAYVPYVLFANPQEKAAIYAALQKIMANLVMYELNIKAINANYLTSTITVAQAMTQTSEQLTAVKDYLNSSETKTAFKNMIVSVLKEKLDGSLVYNKTALIALVDVETTYETMQQDTTKLATYVTQAQDSYARSEEAYNTAVTAQNAGDTSSAVMNFRQAARRMVLVQADVLRAEKEANTLEAANQYSPAYAAQ
ncbi:MAG: hypothetical protein WCW27_02445 [Patescibacteria group bacterium]|jgi:hypothetical protein